MIVPAAYVTWRLQTSAGAEQPWLDGLPAAIAEFCREWRLRLERAEAMTGGTSLNLPATRDVEPVVLRLCPPRHDLDGEVTARQAWNGGAAVRLLAHDPARAAVLLERLDPAASLAGLPLAEADELSPHHEPAGSG